MCKTQFIYTRLKFLHCVVDSHVNQQHEMIICSRGNDSQMRTFTVEFRLSGKECSLLGLSRSVKELFLYILVLCFCYSFLCVQVVVALILFVSSSTRSLSALKIFVT